MRVRRVPSSRPRQARGVVLIEVLVTVIVLSLAALGYAALQLRGLQTQSNGLWRSQATVFMQDASDRLRVNLPGVRAGHYNLLVPSSGDGEGETTACTVAAPCTSQQLATRDYALWVSRLAAALPRGRGAICLDSTPSDGTSTNPACDGLGSQLVVKVFWNERGQSVRVTSVVRP